MRISEISAEELKSKLVVVGGPTATGKSKVAIQIASKFNGEIINADSVQVYKYMDVGSNKDTLVETHEYIQSTLSDGKSVNLRAYKLNNTEIKGWLFDVVSPDINFTVADYQSLAEKVIQNIKSRGKLPIIVGGTGLYIDAVLKGYQVNQKPDEKLRGELNNLSVSDLQLRLEKLGFELNLLNNSDLNNPRRLIRLIEKQGKQGRTDSNFKYDVLFVYPDFDREDLMQKIDMRVRQMIKNGLIEEVQDLIKRGYTLEHKAMQSTGYKQVLEYIEGKIKSEQELIIAISKAHKQYAKRQITWFEGKGRGYDLHFRFDFGMI